MHKTSPNCNPWTSMLLEYEICTLSLWLYESLLHDLCRQVDPAGNTQFPCPQAMQHFCVLWQSGDNNSLNFVKVNIDGGSVCLYVSLLSSRTLSVCPLDHPMTCAQLWHMYWHSKTHAIAHNYRRNTSVKLAHNLHPNNTLDDLHEMGTRLFPMTLTSYTCW